MVFAIDFAPSALDLDDLVSITRDIAADEGAWRHLVRFREDGRWWTRLHGDAALDVWLLTWLADQSTDLHDHGASAAAFTVCEGSLSEVRLTGLTERRTVVAAGSTRTVAPGIVHDVRNPSGRP